MAFKIDRMRLKKSADQNPSTENPSTKYAANSIIIALITKRNRPSVTMVTGIVNKMSTGFTIEFKKAKTKATIIAVRKPSI